MSKKIYLAPKGKAGFTAVDKPSQYKDKETGKLSDPKFVASEIIPEDQVEDLVQQLQPVLDEYYKEVSKKDKTIKKLPVFPKEVSKETGEETGNVIIRATSKFPVQVLDSKKNTIKGVKVGAGSTIQLAFSAKPSLIKKECFLTLYLAAVKVIKLSEGADYSNLFDADDSEDGYVFGEDGAADDGDEEALDQAVNI